MRILKDPRNIFPDVVVYVNKCKKCGRWIKGRSESHVNYNMKIHDQEKHGKEEKNEAK